MLDMLGQVSYPFNTQPTGGVTLYPPDTAAYYDDDGEYVEGITPDPIDIGEANIQPASKKSIEFMIGMGGTANPRDIRDVYINDGTTYLYPEDTGRPADQLGFSDGLAQRRWRVMHSDNRPWHNYCHAIVERVRNSEAT